MILAETIQKPDGRRKRAGLARNLARISKEKTRAMEAAERAASCRAVEADYHSTASALVAAVKVAKLEAEAPAAAAPSAGGDEETADAEAACSEAGAETEDAAGGNSNDRESESPAEAYSAVEETVRLAGLLGPKVRSEAVALLAAAGVRVDVVPEAVANALASTA